MKMHPNGFDQLRIAKTTYPYPMRVIFMFFDLIEGFLYILFVAFDQIGLIIRSHGDHRRQSSCRNINSTGTFAHSIVAVPAPVVTYTFDRLGHRGYNLMLYYN